MKMFRFILGVLLICAVASCGRQSKPIAAETSTYPGKYVVKQ